ncbi:hypothetical protein EUBVEN_01652 [Eubacterium ventriosum ATCC 27560]|uniref:Uncharacterized protein n=1 Tax=Eubacterium ventriosum ATCC 27560 TaxID=411463 RepID=A5Z7G6_9FIRM|nr:hypothetical protein EUBVEN_01652 [Eubacterium ventriosum ATCC 27560]
MQKSTEKMQKFPFVVQNPKEMLIFFRQYKLQNKL